MNEIPNVYHGKLFINNLYVKYAKINKDLKKTLKYLAIIKSFSNFAVNKLTKSRNSDTNLS